MKRRAIGAIVPSSNRTVERTTQAVLRHFPELDSCIGRIPYYGPGLGQPKHAYDLETYRVAAWHLGHAKVGAVTWNGTRGASALADDTALSAVMGEAAECPATTAALDTAKLLQRLGVQRVGFVTPGDPGYAAKAAEGLGVQLAGVKALGLSDNFASSEVAATTIAEATRALAAEARPEAILIWSTNLPGLDVMAALEAELGLPILDSAAIGIWGVLVAAGIDPSPAAPLGKLFAVQG